MDKISFGTDGWRATLDVFTDERVRIVGEAVATYLEDEGYTDPVIIGYDARETSPGFAESLAEIMAGHGFDVLLPKRDCPTPVIAYAIVDRGLSCALMVTASHNPPEYNGVKFIPEDGAPALPDRTEKIEANLAEPDLLPEEEWGEIKEIDPIPSHAEHATDLVGEDLSDLTIVYDAIYGSGQGVTDALLESAGAEVIRNRCERDPTFGGGSPEPSPENLQELADAVDEHDADIGIANDGDSDRIAICTPERGYLDENLFFAAVYDFLLESDSGPAVRSVSTTFLIDRIAEANGEEVVEVPVGFKWVGKAMGESDALIGGEESGGFSIRGHIREKDGVLMALLAGAVTAAEPLDERVDRLLDEHGEIHASKRSVACPDDQKERVLSDLSDHIPESVAGSAVANTVTLDGFKLLLEDGSWLLIRPSGTEPKLRVYGEAGSPERLETLLDEGVDLVEPLV
jgi:phosphomannomutase